MSGSTAIGDLLVPRYPVSNQTIKTVSTVTTAIGIILTVVFSDTVQAKFKAANINSLSVANLRGVGVIAGVILVLPRIAITGWHFYEFTNNPAGDTPSAAMLGEVSNLISYVSAIAYALAVNGEDPSSRLIAVTTKTASDDIYSGLQAAEIIV